MKRYLQISRQNRIVPATVPDKYVADGRFVVIPPEVKEQAALGLKLQAKFGEATRKNRLKGIARARQLSEGDVVARKDLVEIYNYHQRHQVDKASPNFSNLNQPSNGRIAWQLWGSGRGDDAWLWAKRILKKIGTQVP